MVNNSLNRVENTLRSIAKRYKSVKYSLGLAILFLMMGVSAFSEDIIPQAQVLSREEIASSKDNLKGSIGNLQSKIDTAKKENEKGLKGLKLELIQLMEQGDQVVKSPWASWQFGAHYIYSKWNGEYKGRGDKTEKYTYYGKYGQSNNIYENYISPNSKKYSTLSRGTNVTSATSNNRIGLNHSYGLVEAQRVQEGIVGFNVSAAIRPKQVQKGTIIIADKNPVTPEQPEAISFNTPNINITPPAALTLTAAAPTVNAPTVGTPNVNIPNLPSSISFSPVTPSVTAPTAPSISLISPVNLSFTSTGFGQNDQSRINPNLVSATAGKIALENFSNYITGNGGADTLKITSTGALTKWDGTNVSASGGYTSLGGIAPHPNGDLVPGSATSSLHSFISHTIDQNSTISGKYDITRDNTGNQTITFLSLNPYMVGYNSNGDKTVKIGSGATITLHTTIPSGSTNALVAVEHQLLAGTHGGNKVSTYNTPSGATSIFENAGTIDLNSGKNMVGIMIDTEYFYANTNSYFKKKPSTKNTGLIKISSGASESIAIDFGLYIPQPGASDINLFGPNTNVTVGNILIEGTKSYGYRQKDYSSAGNPRYYDVTGTVDGSTGIITLKGSQNVGYSIAQGKSTGDPISNFKKMQVLVAGTNNVGFLRNSNTTATNSNDMVLDAAKLGNTFNFDKTATGGALIRSDIHGIVLDNNITVNKSGVKNSLMQAGGTGTVTLAANKTATSTASAEFYGMTAGDFDGVDDTDVAKAINKGTLNIGGNKSLGIAIDKGDQGSNDTTGTITFSGTNGAGVYNTGTFTNSGKINITGQNSIGIFNSGTGTTTINAGTNSKIVGTAKNSTGVFATGGTVTNNGTISMNAASVKGLVVNKNTANIINKGTVLAKGNGAVAAAALAGTITPTTGTITANGTSGIALYTGGGTINAIGGNIIAENGAINVYAKTGTINFKGATITTKASSLAFMYSKTGTVNFANATIANIGENGTAFYIAPATVPTTVKYSAFTGIGNISSKFTNLSNLTLRMSKNSNVAVASYVRSNLTNLAASNIGSLGAHIQDKSGGAGYNDYLLYKSELTANPGSTYAQFKKVGLSNSSIINNTTLSTNDNKVTLMAQENSVANLAWVKLTNNKIIELKGKNSLAMYAANGTITNSTSASISVGESGVAIYGNNKGIGDTNIVNNGTITVGKNSTAIYATNYVKTGLENKGTISLNGNNAVGMSFAPKFSIAKVFENKGTIKSSTNSLIGNTAMVANKDAKSVQYTALNSGIISLANKGIGMYTNTSKSNVTTAPILSNKGNIIVGEHGIGLFGYQENTTGNITVGNGGIGLYSKGGAVRIGSTSVSPIIKVGNNNATAVFVAGNGQTVTSTNAKYNIGSNSYGFVNTGANTLNISGGSATLTDNGVFIYSSNTSGNIISKTTITSSGSKGSNLGIYSTGIVNNNGNITFIKGIGNIGVYATNNGIINNNGKITLGASTITKRSIGVISNIGTINNIGNVVVNGKYGVGAYSTGSASKVNNKGSITLSGDETIGAYGAGSSNINLISGKVEINGNKSTGYYLDGGTNSKIASGAKINIIGKESNGVYVNNHGVLTYIGTTKVSGDAAYGLIVDGNSKVNATGGTLIVNGTTGINKASSSATNTRGAAGLVVMQGSKLTGNGLTVNANVSGVNSVGIYSAGNLAINSANISAYDSAVNFFTNNGGTLSIGNNGGTSKVVTGTGNTKGALLFYSPSGRILLNGTVNATVEGSSSILKRGTAFYYTGSGTLGNIGTYSTLSPTNVATWAKASFGNGTYSTLGKLNLTMNPNSRLFLTEKINMNLSNTSVTNLFSGLSTSERPNVTGSNYKTFMLYHSHLNVDKAVNLDNTNDGYRLMEISSSAITNNNTINGTKAGQIAMAQENDTTTKSVVTLKNNRIINLSGANSAGIYGKNAIINNTNKITVTKSSTGIYGLKNTEISNTGSITAGNSSTAIYYSDVEKDSKGTIIRVANTVTGLTNAGTIRLNGNDAVGLTYEPGNITGTVTFENSSKASITSTGDKNVGMFAKLALNKATYNTINNGIITLGNSASMNNPNVGMYTNATVRGTNPLINNGNITVGKNSVGIYGFETTNTGNITVGDASVAIYSKGGNINLNGGNIKTATKEAVGVYTVGNGQTITNNNTTFKLGNTSFGFVNVGRGNNITSTGGSATLSNNGVFIYSNDRAGAINNSTAISSTGTTGSNYGIYASGRANNTANINFGAGIGNVGMYMVNGGIGRNSATITVGGSDPSNEIYSVGMAAGYIGDKSTPATTGIIENSGTINVNGISGIGMYGAGARTTVTNNGNIILKASNTTGIYVEEGAKAVNNGVIKTGASGLTNVSGVVLGRGSTLVNNNLIDIDATNGVGVYIKGGTIINEGTINVRGVGSQKKFTLTNTRTTKGIGNVDINAPAGSQTATITDNGVRVRPTIVTTTAQKPVSVSASSVGLYVNTSGKTYTNAINNLGALTSEADLIIGAEAAESTLSKYIQINDSKILGSYNNAIVNGGVSKWNIYAGSLTWISTPTLDKATGAIKNLYMAKISYTQWAKDKNTFNFTDGLEQRYGKEALGSRENEVFQKITKIGNNQEVLLYQAYDEMMGHQYANVQQRIQATGNILDKEFGYLRTDLRAASKNSGKIKTFGSKGEYKTNTAGILGYKNNAYGVAYVHENEDIKLGRGTGWYSGIVQNTIKFKDIGKSKEEQLQTKVGIFKSVPFDDNNSLNWTISGDIFVGHNKMNRKYLVVDEIFNAKSKYYTYGIGIKNEIGKEFRLSEGFSIRPYGALKVEYGRNTKIKEKSGQIRLEVKENDYISVKPEVGTELAYKHYFGTKALRTSIRVAYENEIGKVGDVKNKARVSYTSANWYDLRGEKEDRKGNVKFDLNVGLDNTRIGVNANVGYDTKGENLRGGVGLRVIF
ncbi:hypothetical protein RN96_09970 [Fusobacterium polymorphum]|uniref:Autotransporter domain-containing protein n=1 Tax=Fusobacterium nucleatum subsp. polymorphum TaxID=76857 RepID=A0A2B7YHW8_FUSNP|nr:autotransporter-associated N-terminal domain-containing protein [Fusobacterium polymorphum]PGH20508.1 hypothetical protein RN96_09970 [Fusobacterium polymorphum]